MISGRYNSTEYDRKILNWLVKTLLIKQNPRGNEPVLESSLREQSRPFLTCQIMKDWHIMTVPLGDFLHCSTSKERLDVRYMSIEYPLPSYCLRKENFPC